MPKPVLRNKRIKFPIQEINKDPLQHIKKKKKKQDDEAQLQNSISHDSWHRRS